MRFYRYADSPDEMVFQTIVMNSPFRSGAARWQDFDTDRAELLQNTLKRRLSFVSFNLKYNEFGDHVFT